LIYYTKCDIYNFEGLELRILMVRRFSQFAKNERLSNDTLIQAVGVVESGLVDAHLGGGLIKVRIAREGAGKSGGYRTLLFFHYEERAIFAFGFPKKDKANISARELIALKVTSKSLLSKSETEIDELVLQGKLLELKGHE
jgi:hypothetical protein